MKVWDLMKDDLQDKVRNVHSNTQWEMDERRFHMIENIRHERERKKVR